MSPTQNRKRYRRQPEAGRNGSALSVGHLLFALRLAGIGLAGLALGDFNVIWRPVPKAWPAREALVYGCAIVSLGCGLGLLWRRTAVVAAATLTLWLLLRRRH